MVSLDRRAKKPKQRFPLATASALTATLAPRFGVVVISKYLRYHVSCSGTFFPIRVRS